MMKIIIQNCDGFIVKIAKALEEIGKRRIAITGCSFGVSDGMVEGNSRYAADHLHEIEDGLPGIAKMGDDHIGDDERPGIDEGVFGDALLIFQLNE